jgi:anti-repressor protein
MNELIRIDYKHENPTVSGRELHAKLEVATQYKDWFPRMCEYGFREGKDFSSFLSESTGGRPSTDHMLSIPMAKELDTLPSDKDDSAPGCSYFGIV